MSHLDFDYAFSSPINQTKTEGPTSPVKSFKIFKEFFLCPSLGFMSLNQKIYKSYCEWKFPPTDSIELRFSPKSPQKHVVAWGRNLPQNLGPSRWNHEVIISHPRCQNKTPYFLFSIVTIFTVLFISFFSILIVTAIFCDEPYIVLSSPPPPLSPSPSPHPSSLLITAIPCPTKDPRIYGILPLDLSHNS